MWEKITSKVALVGASVIAILLAIAAIFKKGERAAEVKQQEKQIEATKKAEASRESIDEKISKIPEAPTQSIGAADSDSAAGRLSVWTRD